MTADRAEISPDVMLGKPVIRDTRTPVEIIMRTLSDSATAPIDAAPGAAVSCANHGPPSKLLSLPSTGLQYVPARPARIQPAPERRAGW